MITTYILLSDPEIKRNSCQRTRVSLGVCFLFGFFFWGGGCRGFFVCFFVFGGFYWGGGAGVVTVLLLTHGPEGMLESNTS